MTLDITIPAFWITLIKTGNLYLRHFDNLNSTGISLNIPRYIMEVVMIIKLDHTLTTLFEQLGLSGTQGDMDTFFHNHHLPENIQLHKANFWSESQKQFLEEGIADDGEWAIIIDEMSAMLRH